MCFVRGSVAPYTVAVIRFERLRIFYYDIKSPSCLQEIGIERNLELGRTDSPVRNWLAVEIGDRPTHEIEAFDSDGKRRAALRHHIWFDGLDRGLRRVNWVRRGPPGCFPRAIFVCLYATAPHALQRGHPRQTFHCWTI